MVQLFCVGLCPMRSIQLPGVGVIYVGVYGKPL